MQDVVVAELPERFVMSLGGPHTIPAEPHEPAYRRAVRRMGEYLAAMHNVDQDVDAAVGAVFSNACGDMNALSRFWAAKYFDSFRRGITELIKTLRK